MIFFQNERVVSQSLNPFRNWFRSGWLRFCDRHEVQTRHGLLHGPQTAQGLHVPTGPLSLVSGPDIPSVSFLLNLLEKLERIKTSFLL